MAHAPGDDLQRGGIESLLFQAQEERLQLLLGARAARGLQQPARVEAALQRALQAAKVEAQGGLAQEASELVGAAVHQRFGEPGELHLREHLGGFFPIQLVQLLRGERVEQRSLQPFEQVLGAREVQIEEAIEDRSVRAALHQRGAQGGAERRALLQADQQRGAGGVGHLGRRDAQAVLTQQTGEILQALVHRPQRSPKP